jgi:hypothetical protein
MGSRYRTAGIWRPEVFGKTKIETRNSGKN